MERSRLIGLLIVGALGLLAFATLLECWLRMPAILGCAAVGVATALGLWVRSPREAAPVTREGAINPARVGAVLLGLVGGFALVFVVAMTAGGLFTDRMFIISYSLHAPALAFSGVIIGAGAWMLAWRRLAGWQAALLGVLVGAGMYGVMHWFAQRAPDWG
jgi:hypothetical protein